MNSDALTVDTDPASLIRAVRCGAAFATSFVVVTLPGTESAHWIGLEEWESDRRRVMEWPGTRKFSGPPHELVEYTLPADEVGDFLEIFRRVARAPAQSDEDFALLRPDGTPLFVWTAHEDDAYFLLRGDERDRIVECLASAGKQ